MHHTLCTIVLQLFLAVPCFLPVAHRQGAKTNDIAARLRRGGISDRLAIWQQVSTKA